MTIRGSNLLEIIERMREFDSQMEIQACAVFFCVGLHQNMTVKGRNYGEGIPMQEISRKLGIAQSSVSRNVYKLSYINRHRSKGVDLLEAYEDPMERRRKLVRLSRKGQRVYESLSNLVVPPYPHKIVKSKQ